MINESRKRLFIYERYPNIGEETKINYWRILNMICELEDYYKVDLSQFTVNQLNGILDKLSTNYKNYMRYANMMTNYLEWCGVSVRPKLEYNGGCSIAHKYYDTFDNFYYDIERNLTIHENSVEAYYGLILMFVWVGLTKEEIYTIKKQEIDYQHNTIITPRYTYPLIDDKVLELCAFCSQMKDYGSPYTDLVNNDLIFRKKESNSLGKHDTIHMSTLHHAFDRFNFKACKKCNFNTIRKSGLFEYLYFLEEAGQLSSKSQTTLWTHYVERHFGKKSSNTQCVRQDYYNWKKCFYG